ncbi:MAG: flavin reductase family protein [Candidatus Dormibacteraeota bacterium]|nr:flavin reductase family protein [Candidatus Dormibacteraeota bacterium]
MEVALKEALAAHAAGVAVVVAGDNAGFRGLTATSFTALSLEPALIAVCLSRPSQTLDAVAASRVFSVSLLDRRQEFLAERFAGRAPAVDATWDEVAHTLGANGVPIVAGSVAWFECAVANILETGDHDLVLARVAAHGRGSGEPLVLWDRAFWGLA